MTNPSSKQVEPVLERLSDEQLNGTMAAAQIAHGARCLLEVDATTVIRLCQEVHNIRVDSVASTVDAAWIAETTAREYVSKSLLPEGANLELSRNDWQRAKGAEKVLERIRATASPAAPEGEATPATLCSWTYDPDGYWQTACGDQFCITEGTPAENRMRYCHYCGRQIAATPSPEPRIMEDNSMRGNDFVYRIPANNEEAK